MTKVENTQSCARSSATPASAPKKQATSTVKPPQFVYNAALDSYTQVDPAAEQRGRDAINLFIDKIEAYFGASPPKR